MIAFLPVSLRRMPARSHASQGAATSPHCLRVLFALALFVALTPDRSAHAADEAWQGCEQASDWDRKIAGCTAVLARGSAEPARSRARALALRTQAYLAKRNFERAIADATEALLFEANNATALNNRGLAYIETGQNDRAIRDLSEAIRLLPEHSIALGNRGLAYLNRNEFDNAIKDLSQAIRIDPRSGTLFINRGLAYAGRRDFERAAADCEDALKREPAAPMAHVCRGIVLTEKGERDEAAKAFDKALQLDPRSFGALVQRGGLHMDQRAFDRAIDDYTQAITLAPGLAVAHLGRGIAFFETGDNDRAIKDLDETLRLDPTAVQALVGRGVIRARQGGHDRAIADYDAALRLDPKDPRALHHRARAYAALGDTRKALEDYDAALAIDPTMTDTRDGRESVLALVNDARPPPSSEPADAKPSVTVGKLEDQSMSPVETARKASQPPLRTDDPKPDHAEKIAEANPTPPDEEAEDAKPPKPAELAAAHRIGDRRFALVIGIDDYWVLEDLRAARNDARAVGKTLAELGFDVVEGTDLDHAGMSAKLAELAQKIEPGDAVFVFFAGHGFAVGQSNYLLPADMPMVEKGQEGLFKFKAFGADQLTDLLQARGARTAILVLDACRNNPFERPGGRAPVPGSRGLARIEPPEGVFILYSAASHQVALDRLGRDDSNPNSVFTRVFVEELRKPDTPFAEIADRTRRRVRDLARRAGKDQRPAFYNEIIEPFVLN